MENFFYEDRFCTDLYELMIELDIDEEKVNELPDDWSVECQHTSVVPFARIIDVGLLTDIIMDNNEDNMPEDPDWIEKKINDALLASVNFDKLNKMMPEIHKTNGIKFTVTKADLIAWCENTQPTT